MQRNEGFTLIEAMVACGLLVAISVGTTQLFGFAITQSIIARQQLVMGVMATGKLDELSAAVGAGPVSISPSDALDRNVVGCFETLSQSGRIYVRRWALAEVPGFATEAYVIVVRVVPATGAGGEVRMVTVRAVTPP